MCLCICMRKGEVDKLAIANDLPTLRTTGIKNVFACFLFADVFIHILHIVPTGLKKEVIHCLL